MARSIGARKRSIEGKSKVKTGCGTCRKVKCDENKPFCQKCVGTGRTCDGYDSPFRFYTRQPIKNAHSDGTESDVGLQHTSPTSTEIAPRDIELLNRCFSTKTLFDVKLDCEEEARQVLQASLSDPPIHHAILSLRAHREGLEASTDGPPFAVRQRLSSDNGLQQYCMALGGLASSLSSSRSNQLKSTLLCCQIFISIEHTRRNYNAMAQHIVRGLSIMHEYRARPCLVTATELVPAHRDEIPFLDVFVIKLFTAPCMFAEPRSSANVNGMAKSSVHPILPDQQLVRPRDLRTIAPDMTRKLKIVGASTLDFLGKVSQVESSGNALRLLSEKAALLDSLESWLNDVNLVRGEAGPSDSEPISITFMRLFHLILKVILLGALDSSPDLHAENDRLQGTANDLTERLRDYEM